MHEINISEKQIDYTKLNTGDMFHGRYEIIRALEKGSGGSVYLVKDHLHMKMNETHSSDTEPNNYYKTVDSQIKQNSLQVLKIYSNM